MELYSQTLGSSKFVIQIAFKRWQNKHISLGEAFNLFPVAFMLPCGLQASSTVLLTGLRQHISEDKFLRLV